MNAVRRYFLDLWQIISQPTLFFRRMSVEGGITHPLAFALITHWLGSAAKFLWQNAIGGFFQTYVDQALKMAGDVAEIDSPGRRAMIFDMKDRITHWMFGVGSVLLDPFTTVLGILITSAFVYAGALLFVPRGGPGQAKVSYESALRIVCFGMSPAILAAIPLAGGFLSWILVCIVTVIGAREVYRISGLRAIVVGLFPKVLFLGIILAGLALLLLVGLKFFLSAF